jgi:hypothetical protein
MALDGSLLPARGDRARRRTSSLASAWQRAQGLARRPRAFEMDAQVHAERVEPRTRRRRTRPAQLAALPDGAFVMLGDAAAPWLRRSWTVEIIPGAAPCARRPGFAST